MNSNVQFYELSRSLWGTDMATRRASPLDRIESCRMPNLHCTTCGKEQSRYNINYDIVSQRTVEKLRDLTPLETLEWKELADWVRKENGLPADYPLYPGTTIGLPVYEQFAIVKHDIIWPFMEAVITRRLLELLNEAGATGFKSVAAELRWKTSLRDRLLPHPELFTLVITGRAWTVGSYQETLCNDCGAVKKYLRRGEVDMQRWDGSDMFCTNGDLGSICVTERVREIFERNDVGNYVAIPVAELPPDEDDYLDFKWARLVADFDDLMAKKGQEKKRRKK